MAASILFACGLNEHKLPPVIHISEESNMDGSFLISSILCQRLRISNSGTLLICLQHNYGHYTKAGIRLGYDCNIFLGKTLNVIDPLWDIIKNFPNSLWLKKCNKNNNNNNHNNIALILLQQIQDHINQPSFSTRIHNTIIIDNIEILYNLGASQKDVHEFCMGLMKLIDEIPHLTLITKIGNCDIYEVEDNNLKKWAFIHLQIAKLKSGSFREVDGKIFIKRFSYETENGNNESGNAINDNDTIILGNAAVAAVDDKIKNDITMAYECIFSDKEILYKVNERHIKIYNPGEIGLKM